jgi:hypothetical protein
MAFPLPDDLAPELYPLAWLLGRWHGFGMVGYHEIPQRDVVAETTFDHDGGPYLRSTSTLWLADDALSGPVDPEMPGAEGYRALVKDVQWATETAYWRPVGSRPAGSGTAVDLEVVCSDPAGSLSLYLGTAEGPRITLATDAVVTSPSAARVSAAGRMYGLVASDLLWVQDLAAFGQELGPYSSGRLSRVEQ